ncbi:MAG: amidohydrolase/deacetylase family metallohydrolase [Saprospiraceae bacterium]|nr:amidohydrolase/deacetylase family metallohydrolase [Saprospiraceae bacterium]
MISKSKGQSSSISKLEILVCGKLATFLVVILVVSGIQAQSYDLLLQGGHVFDAANGINGVMDLAIHEGKVAKVALEIDPKDSKKIIDVSGLFVCPGLIDIHTHVFVGNQIGKFANGINSLSPDDFTLRAGITTVVDAGTSGWRNFPQFKEQVIETSKTRVLAFLNIAGYGMTGDSIQADHDEMKVREAVNLIKEYPDDIVGVKIGHYEGKSWIPFDRTIKAAEKTDRPIFVECHLPQYTLQEQLDKMRPGDIITHSYEKVSERMSVVNEDGVVRPFVLEAQERGVLFDVGHGGAGFWFSEALPALEQGLAPNSFGSDLHRFSVNAGMKDMLNIMSKYLAMGMPLNDVLQRATWNPARAIKRRDLGNLSEGSVADIAVLKLREGAFGFVDAGKKRLDGNQRFEAELTIREGKIVYDLNGISMLPFDGNQ